MTTINELRKKYEDKLKERNYKLCLTEVALRQHSTQSLSNEYHDIKRDIETYEEILKDLKELEKNQNQKMTFKDCTGITSSGERV